MSERDRYAPGTFSWADLATSDVDGAREFYAGLFGWEYEALPAGEGAVYVMARLGGHDVAALTTAGDQPPHWDSYVTVADADDAARRAGDLGATVLMQPFDVMDAGRMAVVQDPTGAVLAVWEPRSHPGAGLVNATGAMTWNDLTTPDVDAAARFYGEWLGWTVEEIPGAGGYRVIRNGDRTNGGMQPLRREVMGPDVPPNWMPYFGTDGLEATAARAVELGGSVLVGPISVPAGSFAVIADPQGAVCALWGGSYDD